VRLVLGNGMNAEVWARLQHRFRLEKIVEFYAATEFPGAIVNLTGEVGSVGHVPFERLRGYRLVRVELETGAIARDARGRAIACGPGEPGELVLRLKPVAHDNVGGYLGYLGERPGAERIARDLFREGDVYCRSGDLLRRERTGAYFFVDRLGDTYRFKGENVSTREVEQMFDGIPSVRARGRVITPRRRRGRARRTDFMEALREARRLPAFARPFRGVTRGLRHRFAPEGCRQVDPSSVSEPVYYLRGDRYVPLEIADYQRILNGEQRF
jgi:fatty-acyl-CoA synthase